MDKGKMAVARVGRGQGRRAQQRLRFSNGIRAMSDGADEQDL